MKKTLIVLVLSALAVFHASAADTRLIPFQGRVTDSENQAINGVYTVVFSIYEDPTGGSSIWSESHQNVSIIQGYVNVLLGATNPINLPEASGETGTIDFSEDKYIGIKIGPNGQEMLPRHQIVPSFHAQMADQATEAFNARNADKLGNHPPDYYASSEKLNKRIDELEAKIEVLESTTDKMKVDFDASYDTLEDLVAPVGSIVWFTGTNIPEGWMKCDGRTLNREGQYAALWAHADASGNLQDDSVWRNQKKGGFGYGNGTTTFTIPDLRGEFIRAWTDDSTIDTNRQLGSTQTDAGRNLTGELPAYRSSSHAGTGAFFGSIADSNVRVKDGTNGGTFFDIDASRVWGEAHTTGQRVDGTDLPDPNPEFRPRNIPMIPIIKYK